MQKFYNEVRVIRPLVNFALIFIGVFAFYIQFHGKISPGGGFQSGIIFAILLAVSNLVDYAIDKKYSPRFFQKSRIYLIASGGIICYTVTGLAPLLFGGNLFEYAAFPVALTTANQIGILGIEIGVCLGVFGGVSIIFRCFIDELALFQEKNAVVNQQNYPVKNPHDSHNLLS